MNKEFVPNEQALALKELGFDTDDYFGFWNLFEYSGEWKLDSRIHRDSLDYIEAPTFSQAFRWFREKYGLYGIPEERTLNNFSYQVKSNKEGAITFIVYGGYPLNFNTYEEAELACLIKLIEIVKQKQ